RTGYDAILMDCQMPEMDGFEATATIRAGEAANAAARTPIIALTANAIQGDRERCLTVGMDDYIAKPVKREHLMAALRPWISAPNSSPAAPVPAPDHPPPAAAVDRVALMRNLSFGGRAKTTTLLKVTGLFLSETPALLAAIRDGLAHGDDRLVERSVHTIKSSAATVAAFALSETAAAVESHVRVGRMDEVRGLAATLDERFEQAARQLAALREEIGQGEVAASAI
ncbi:MAG: response regulator, partial [Rhizobacter sp.]|nr:response regulator [Rhizobacter sp.]